MSMCVLVGAKPVLVVNDKVVTISNPDKVGESLYGKKVKVTGDMEGENESITISTIAAAE